jgi:hypothetical protein
MKEILAKYIQKAEDNCGDALFLWQDERFDSAVNRAYYAIFHCVEAFLFFKDIHTKTHEGALRKFAELYIKTGELDRKWSDILIENFEARQEADYAFDAVINAKEAKILVENAESFLTMTKQYFENLK